MKTVLSIAAGGALGALLRFWLSTGVYLLVGRDMSLDLPVVVEFFDAPERVRAIVAELEKSVAPGHVVWWTAEVNDGAALGD